MIDAVLMRSIERRHFLNEACLNKRVAFGFGLKCAIVSSIMPYDHKLIEIISFTSMNHTHMTRKASEFETCNLYVLGDVK